MKVQGGSYVPLRGGAAVKAYKEEREGREAYPPRVREQMASLSGLYTALQRALWVYPGDPKRAKQNVAYQQLLEATKAWEAAASKILAAYK